MILRDCSDVIGQNIAHPSMFPENTSVLKQVQKLFIATRHPLAHGPRDSCARMDGIQGRASYYLTADAPDGTLQIGVSRCHRRTAGWKDAQLRLCEDVFSAFSRSHGDPVVETSWPAFYPKGCSPSIVGLLPAA